MLKVGPGGFLESAGYAETDDKGKFQAVIDRSNFKGRRIVFTIQVPESTDGLPQRVMNTKGVLITLHVTETMAVLDIDKLSGPIILKKR